MAGRRKTRIPLAVFLNGRLVGRLSRQASGAIDFQYAPEWLSWESAFPVSLSLPLREDRYIGGPVTAVFDNLLPDNDQIRRRLAARTDAGGTDAFSLLAAVGRDCVGALQFLPDGEAPADFGNVSGRPLSDVEIAAILGDLAQAPLGVTTESEFRISLAGAQEKTALLRWKGCWHIPHGATPTTHILKPEIGRLQSGLDLSDSVENEFFCLKLTQALGLPSADVEIQRFRKRPVLVVERFDRRWTKDRRLIRLPQEDCCQALSVAPTRKYETEGGPGIRQILELLKASDEPEIDRRLFLKAQILFWLLGAIDGHAKNFSIQLMPGGRFRLAPLYDIMSAQPYVDAGQIRISQYKLAMAVGDNRHYRIDQINTHHFEQAAAASGMDRTIVTAILHEFATTMPAALDSATAALPKGVSLRMAEQIAKGVRDRLRIVSHSVV